MTFYSYIRTREKTYDIKDDFVCYCLKDNEFPEESDSWEIIESYLVESGANHSIINAGRDVWFEYFSHKFRDIYKEIKNGVEEIKASIKEFQVIIDGKIRIVKESIDRYHIKEMMHCYEAGKPMKAAGIIPHISAPWNKFDRNNPDIFPAVVLEHYSNNWADAEKVFINSIDSYKISELSKSSFREALFCHRNGIYRPSVLTLFSTIEYEFRLLFEIDQSGKATSIKELREIHKKMPFGCLFRPIAPLFIYEILDKHLYDYINSSDKIKTLINDPIPNRHAAIHGIVFYNTALNSLNTIIMADYIFHVMNELIILNERRNSSENYEVPIILRP